MLYILNIILYIGINICEIHLLLNFNIIVYSFVHFIFSLIDLYNNKNQKFDFLIILDCIIILFYTEIIQIHICGCDKYYDKNIMKRERDEMNNLLA